MTIVSIRHQLSTTTNFQIFDYVYGSSRKYMGMCRARTWLPAWVGLQQLIQRRVMPNRKKKRTTKFPPLGSKSPPPVFKSLVEVQTMVGRVNALGALKAVKDGTMGCGGVWRAFLYSRTQYFYIPSRNSIINFRNVKLFWHSHAHSYFRPPPQCRWTIAMLSVQGLVLLTKSMQCTYIIA